MSQAQSAQSVQSNEQPRELLAHNTRWLSRGLWVRVLIYLAGSHLFAAFLYLLFAIGSRHSH